MAEMTNATTLVTRQNATHGDDIDTPFLFFFLKNDFF
jgi:hypothetical protein